MLTLAMVPTDPELDNELSVTANRLTDALDADDADAGDRLLAEARALARAGSRRVVLAVEPAGAAHDALAERTGFVRTRELLQLRRPLPVGRRATLEVRSFRPGTDDEAWLEINNRAFAWHPDQGGWTSADLHERIAEPWFDPKGFLLHEAGGRLAGFCWTKIHPESEPPLGEIFAIAVDPDHHGQGLGEQLTLAGLDWLAGQGLQTAMLYVEADNTSARSLYARLGFDVHHAKRWWAAESP